MFEQENLESQGTALKHRHRVVQFRKHSSSWVGSSWQAGKRSRAGIISFLIMWDGLRGSEGARGGFGNVRARGSEPSGKD